MGRRTSNCYRIAVLASSLLLLLLHVGACSRRRRCSSAKGRSTEPGLRSRWQRLRCGRCLGTRGRSSKLRLRSRRARGCSTEPLLPPAATPRSTRLVRGAAGCSSPTSRCGTRVCHSRRGAHLQRGRVGCRVRLHPLESRAAGEPAVAQNRLRYHAGSEHGAPWFVPVLRGRGPRSSLCFFAAAKRSSYSSGASATSLAERHR